MADTEVLSVMRKMVEDLRDHGMSLEGLRHTLTSHCQNLLDYNIATRDEVIDALVNLAVEYV